MAEFKVMPGFEELIEFVEENRGKEVEIPKPMLRKLIRLLNTTEEYEANKVIGSIQQGINSAVGQEFRTHLAALALRVEELEKVVGAPSNFFTELFFSVFVEFNILGRLVHRAGKSLLSRLGPTVTRRPLVRIYKRFVSKETGKARYLEHVNKLVNVNRQALKHPGKFKKMLLGVAERTANYAKKTPAVVYGRDTVTAFAGPIKGALARNTIRAFDSSSPNRHFSSKLADKIVGGLIDYGNDVRYHYEALREELLEELDDPEVKILNMERFAVLVDMHHYDQSAQAVDIIAFTAAVFKKIIWTLTLQESDPKVLEWLSLADHIKRLPNPHYNMSTPDRQKGMLLLRQLGLDELFGVSQPREFYPNQQVLGNTFLIGLLAEEFLIQHNGKLASIAQHAKDEFPSVTFDDRDKPGGLDKIRKMERFLGESVPGPNRYGSFGETIEWIKEGVKKSRDIFMRDGVYSVLNDTALKLKRHELGDLDWIIYNKVKGVAGVP